MHNYSANAFPHADNSRGNERIPDALYCVTVNWNGAPDTLKCVASLVAAGCPLDRVIVVDSGSTDDSVRQLRNFYGDSLTIISLVTNVGFGAAANAGINAVLGLHAAWVFVLNNDTVVAPDMFQQFHRGIAAARTWAIAAPLIRRYDGPRSIWSSGERAIGRSHLTFDSWRGKREIGILPPLRSVDYVTGCGMLINAEVFARIGMFDARYFMYAEDADFCERARRAGFQIVCLTRALMWHKISRSAWKAAEAMLFLRLRNQIWFYRRYAGLCERAVLLLVTFVRAMGRLAAAIMRLQWKTAEAIVASWATGWFLEMSVDCNQTGC